MKKDTQTSGKKNGKLFLPREPELRETFTETALGLNMEMVYVEGGEFEMGATEEQGDDADDREKPVRNIKLDGFHIGKYEVTQAQWKAVMGTNPSYFKGENRPVESVGWKEAQEFCKRLSKRTGKKYSLPTEAQWEYAARGGVHKTKTKYAGSNDIDEVAWYRENSHNLGLEHPDYGTHSVGEKKSNELGIYDMNGNIWEWCSDWYGSYDENDTENPLGPAKGTLRVMRGGRWFSNAVNCRVSYRNYDLPNHHRDDLGFRVVCISK